MIIIFEASKLRKGFCKTIFVFLEVQFHHEGGLSESRYFELFSSGRPIFSTCQKSASAEAPFNLLWTLAIILAKLTFQKYDENHLVQNLGRDHPKKWKNLFWWIYWMRKKGLLLPTFVTFQTPLTNCAMVQWSNGPLKQSTNDPMVQCTHGPHFNAMLYSNRLGLGWDMLWVLVLDFCLFKWTFDCSLFWVWRRVSLTVRIFSQKSITKW